VIKRFRMLRWKTTAMNISMKVAQFIAVMWYTVSGFNVLYKALL